MTVQITEKAARQIEKQLAKRGGGLGLRLGVRKSGCSGFAYALDFADEMAADEQVFEQHGVKVLVRTEDLPVLEGIELDYTREGIGEAFRFNNPNVKATCGCGESFAV
ncbi:HesB/IscA family protein [Methylogaea oryzae]|uniref:HesB family protein n=1 Tax=Methylogaea oryzae TaxID=1295382 RepID=A0A8D4VQ20_9GAMM|nr:iron-sulfur cluster assembly accessory protein [Methylogaea oryzae]BBL71958.1 HesB family protein [Methylogaea oryzae]